MFTERQVEVGFIYCYMYVSYFLFLPKRTIKKMISAIIAITIKMPTPIPALKIPSITAQELNIVVDSTTNNVLIEFVIFMLCHLVLNHSMFFLNWLLLTSVLFFCSGALQKTLPSSSLFTI